MLLYINDLTLHRYNYLPYSPTYPSRYLNLNFSDFTYLYSFFTLIQKCRNTHPLLPSISPSLNGSFIPSLPPFLPRRSSLLILYSQGRLREASSLSLSLSLSISLSLSLSLSLLRWATSFSLRRIPVRRGYSLNSKYSSILMENRAI